MGKIVKFFLIGGYSCALFSATHNPEQFLTSIKGSKNEGQQIVQQFCATCHAAKPLIELGAPKCGVRQDWQSRLQQGLALLFKHTEEGLGAMPPRGGCFECTDEQLRLAIAVLLPKIQKDPK